MESREADSNPTSSTDSVGFIFTDLINAYKALTMSQELFLALYNGNSSNCFERQFLQPFC